MRAPFTRAVGLPLATIVAIQTVLTMGAYALPVVVPIAAPDLGIEPESVGYLVAVTYLSAMLTGLGAGNLLARFGATRVFQSLLILVGIGAVVLTMGSLLAAVLAAILIGTASGPMNPSGSQVLARVTSGHDRALVFSLKQCGTPAGGMLAGMLLPPLLIAYEWQVAMLVVPVMALVLFCVAPFGALGGAPPDQPRSTTPLRDALHAVCGVLADRRIRAVTLAGLVLAACQMALGTYLVVYLWRSVGYTPAQAGLVFAVLHVAGIVSRIALGTVADRLLSARTVLVLIGLTMSLALMLITQITAAWPLTAVYALMALAGATGNGWVGLFFAELARLSDPARVAEVAAGSQFVMYMGIVCGPLAFGALLQLTGGYGPSFGVFAAVALAGGIYLRAAGREPP